MVRACETKFCQLKCSIATSDRKEVEVGNQGHKIDKGRSENQEYGHQCYSRDGSQRIGDGSYNLFVSKTWRKRKNMKIFISTFLHLRLMWFLLWVMMKTALYVSDPHIKLRATYVPAALHLLRESTVLCLQRFSKLDQSQYCLTGYVCWWLPRGKKVGKRRMWSSVAGPL